MGQTLTNGVYLPDEGERNCYTGLAENWRALDYLIGGYNVHIADAVIHVSQADRDKWDAVDNKADTTALTAHTGNTTIHVTAADKEAWNGKADASALTAHTGDTTIHVTAEDKNKWDAVTTKANDASVMHLTGDETATGIKNFVDNIVAKKIVSNASQLQINAKTNADSVAIIAGSSATEGGGIWIYGKNSSNQSHVAMQVYDTNASTFHAARLNMDGSLTPTVANNGLGSSYFKWRGFNSINPGALSLPNLSAGVDISGYITTGNTTQTYTPPTNGWISLGCAASAQNAIYVWDVTNGWGSSSRSISNDTYNNFSVLTIPVLAGTPITIELRAVTTLVWAKFFPCMGNV